MYLWFLVIAVFIPQEFATTGLVLLLALQNNFPIWGVHLIWLGATFFDMYIGFTAGKLVQKRFQNTRFVNRVEVWVEKAKRTLGLHGEKFSLAILGFFNFPYLNTFLGAWLGMSRRTAFITTFIGNFAWYIFLWGTILGLSSLTSNPDILLLILIAIGILSNFLFKFPRQRRHEDE